MWLRTLAASTSLLACSDPGSDAAPEPQTDAAVAPQEDLPALRINEVQAFDQEWFEVANLSASPVSTRGLSVTDGDESGSPRADHDTPFPRGFTLEPGERFVVLLKPSPLLEGVQAGRDCRFSLERCMHADFGLGENRGDHVFLRNANQTVIDHVHYRSGAAEPPNTYCRMPDGDGAWQSCPPTPGLANDADPVPWEEDAGAGADAGTRWP